jgi:hypothetical protein
MDFLEKDLEEILYTSNMYEVQSRGLDLFPYDRIYRQVPIGNYGIADLITVEKAFGRYQVLVYELKNKTINAASFWQVVRYMRGIKHFLSRTKMSQKFIVKGVLLAREVELSGEVCYLPMIQSDIFLYTYQYELSGMRFNRYEGAHLSSPGALKPSNFDHPTFRKVLKDLASIPDFFDNPENSMSSQQDTQ